MEKRKKIKPDVDVVDRLVADKDKFLKRTDHSEAEGGIKNAILQARRAGGTPLDEVAIHKGLFGKGKAGEGAKATTVKGYSAIANKFFTWLNKNKLSWTKLSEENIADFYRESLGKNISELHPSHVAPLKNLSIARS